ncbi:MAG: PAS domain S-box protein [Pseudomonadota bacterium]
MTTSARILLLRAQRLFRVILLPGFALSLLAAMWVAMFYQITIEHQSARREAVAHTQAMAHVLSEHVSHTLRQTDHATQLFKLKFEETDGALRLPEFTRRNGLLDSVLPARLDLPIALIDRDGKVIDSAHAFMPANVADQAYFKALAAASDDTPYFSTPQVDARSRKWQVQVARRLEDRDGRFAGLIVIMVDPALFIDDYDRLNIDEKGVLLLMAKESGLSIGRVGEQMFIRDDIDFQPRRDSAAVADEVVPLKAFDDVERLYSASDLPRYALLAVLGVPEQVAMAKFERHRVLYSWIMLLASILIVAIVAMLMRQSAQLRRSIRTAREAQATLRAATEGSLDAFLVLKAWPGGGRPVEDFIIADLNAKGAALLLQPRAQLIGMKAFASLPRYRQTGFFERYKAVMVAGVPAEEETEVRLDNDAPRWIHHQIVPIEGGVAVTSREITERKQAELEIRSNRSFLQSLIEHLPLLIYVKSVRPDSFGTMVVWNKAAEDVTGYDAAAVIGKRDSQAFPDNYALRNEQEDRAMLANPVAVDLPEKPLLRPDGTLRYLHSVSVPLLDEHERPEYILCIAEDVTRRREQELNLRTSEAELAAITNASPLGLVRTDLNGDCSYVNRMFETITGLSREQARGQGWLGALHPQDRTVLEDVFAHQKKSDEPFKHVVRCLRPDGVPVWASLKVAAIRIDERIEGFVGTLDDITTLREAELALRESESRLRTIADTLPAMVAYIDAHEIYRFHNTAYDREFGRAGSQVPGMTIRETVGDKRYAALLPFIRRVLAGETLIFEEHDESEGVERTLEVTYIPQMGEDGETVVGFHVMRQDITTQKREKKRLLKLAQVDALTGLVNRAGFLQKLELAMQECADERRLMAVMYMDIDHFKPVNDTYGHNVGDALLKAFSSRLTHTLRATDTIARLGGDEFTIIMEKISRPEDASTIAAKIVAAMQAPFELEGATVSVSASIGLAFFRDGAIEPDALLKQADMLLYQAKQAGRNTYRAAA